MYQSLGGIVSWDYVDDHEHKGGFAENQENKVRSLK